MQNLPSAELYTTPKDGHNAPNGDGKFTPLQPPASSVHHGVVEPSLCTNVARQRTGNHDETSAEYDGAHGHAGAQPIGDEGAGHLQDGDLEAFRDPEATDAVPVPRPPGHGDGVHIPVGEVVSGKAFRGSGLEGKPTGELAGDHDVDVWV